MHCTLRPSPCRANCLKLFLAKCVLRMRTDCYFLASDQHSDIAIRFSDFDVLKQVNNLVIR